MEEEGMAEERPRTCGKGHRSSLLLPTPSGGAICLVCFSNLVSNASSPPHHVSYALSQLSQAVSGSEGVEFRRSLVSCHAHFLVTPLVQALCSFEDEAVGRQVVDLVSDLCCGGEGLVRDFVVRIAERISSGAMAWSRRLIYSLHCLGVLLDYCHKTGDSSAWIKDTTALVSNLITGLQLPSEELRGEIPFVLYKLSLLQAMPWDDDDTGDDDFSAKLLHVTLEALLKTLRDDVRLNCIALLTVLVQRGHFQIFFTKNHIGYGSTEEDMVNLFIDAMKGPLLSSDTQVQIGMLNLVFDFISLEASNEPQIQLFVEEGVADYIFEILRLSENKDPLVVSCLRVLDLLSTAEEIFRQRLVIGLPVLLNVLHYIAEIPLHPVHAHALRLVERCLSNCPGVISISQLEELAQILTEILRRHTSGELGMLPETFILVCSTFAEVLQSPSSGQVPKIAALIQEASINVISTSLSAHRSTSGLVLHSLYLLKEAYCYSQEDSANMITHSNELAMSILETCETHLLPWLRRGMNEGEEEDAVLGVLETFHLILIQGPEIQSRKFAKVLASSSWFNLSFGFLGLFPSERMKFRIYLMLGSVVDGVFGQDLGQPIRDSYFDLPSDPLDLLFLLGQKTTLDDTLIPAQSAVVSILYASLLYDQRLADDNQVLASLEQYFLLNNGNFTNGIAGSVVLTQLVHLYGFVRAAQETSGAVYSSETEKIVFHLITENDWDLFSMGIHPTALKWLFKQDKISSFLSKQILDFCRCYSKRGSQLNSHASEIHVINIQTIADMVVSGDNYVASLLTSLFKHSQEVSKSQEDLVVVADVIHAILNIFPEASNEFCVHGIDSAIYGLYSSYFSEQIFTNCSILLFNVLQTVNSETLCNGRSWLLLTFKLLEFLIPRLSDETCNKEACQIIGILSLILEHSTHHTLFDASTAILLNSSLVSAVNTIIQAFCAKGPVLADYNEETSSGELLIFVLLLYFFSLKSLYALLQETLDWQDLLQLPDGTQTSSVICIHCHDLCRLVHFGPSVVKLIASQCLLEVLSRISHHREKIHDELRCSTRHLQSMIAVTEGLIFYEDSKTATNCGLCLSMILGWPKMRSGDKKTINISKWCRLVMEELALSLAAPGLPSKSFTSQHKPATHVAIALLKLDQTPGWMRSVFNASCISGVIDKLTASSVSAEIVELFRELYAREYLSKVQVGSLQNVFQACRKHIYGESSKENCTADNTKKVITDPSDTGNMFKVLIHLMLSTEKCCNGIQREQKKLLEEIELFFQLSVTE